MPIFSIERRLGIFKGHSNISTNKYDILITDRGSFPWRNGLLAKHREYSHLCQDFRILKTGLCSLLLSGVID